MKSQWFVLATITLLTLVACGGGSGGSYSPPPPAIHNEWTWMSGSSVVYQKGIYGTMGMASQNNTPGARTSPSSWTDVSGDLWLFGGYGIDSNGNRGDLNDLWEFRNDKRIWVGGSSVIEAKGVYGTKGVAASANVPGGRYEAVSWTDASGNFWLFGGLGIDSNGNRGDLNDLWEFSNDKWTWIGGMNIAISATDWGLYPGVYGTKGVAAPDNWPGARVDAMTWTDASGDLWLFGGEGFDSNGVIGILNDLWKYTAGEWTWMSGRNTAGPFQPGVYGTLGTPAPDNVPGPRTSSATWTDLDGNLWLFGGQGNDATGGAICSANGGPCLLNDLWEYAGGEWTWIGGSNLSNSPGVYGTIGIAAPNNFPGARWMAVAWIDPEGAVWLFGGQGMDSSISPPVFGDLNDLWKFSDGQWTWISGSNLASTIPLGVYGTMGVPAPGNVPTQREDAVGWVDHSGNLWLFGGDDIFCCAQGGSFNDLWEYQP